MALRRKFFFLAYRNGVWKNHHIWLKYRNKRFDIENSWLFQKFTTIMKEFENQEVCEKMSWKGFASKLMQPDAPGLRKFYSQQLQNIRRFKISIMDIEKSDEVIFICIALKLTLTKNQKFSPTLQFFVEKYELIIFSYLLITFYQHKFRNSSQ